MLSSVSSLFQRQPAAAVHAQPAQGALAKLLKQQATDVLHVQIKAMFDCADDTLFDWARRAFGEEQHRCMSLMRILRVRKPEVVDHFFKNFSQQFDHPARPSKKKKKADYSGELSMQPTEDLEESIALTNMTARAEGLFRDQIFELGRRLEWAADHRDEHVPRLVMEPLAISEAFLEASRTIDMEIESRLVVLKLFERTVMIQLGDFYNRLLNTLDENGIQAAANAQNSPLGEDSAEDSTYQPSPMSSMLSALGAVAHPQGSASSGLAGSSPHSHDHFSPPGAHAGAGAGGMGNMGGGMGGVGGGMPQGIPGNAGHPGFGPNMGAGAGMGFGPAAAQGMGMPSGAGFGPVAAPGMGMPAGAGFGPAAAPGVGMPTGAGFGPAAVPGMSSGFGTGLNSSMGPDHYGSVPPGAYPGGPRPMRAPIGAYGLPLPPGYAAYAGYTDANLASELSERLSAWVQKPQANHAQEPIAQRADLIGRMFDGFQNDAALPESVKPTLETLRFPVLKAALSDPSFLVNTEHPLRVLLHDLAATASSARTSPNDPTANLNALSEAMAPLLTPDAPVVRANIDNPAPVSEDDVQAFLGHMDEEAASRRKTIVQRGMQRVDEELQRVTEARELLATAELLIDRALRPFLGLTLLRHSIASPLWAQSLNLAERVIRSVDMIHAKDLTNNDRSQVRDDLEDALVLERMPRERNEEAITSLRALHDEIEAYLEQKAPAPIKAAPNPQREAARHKTLRDYLTLGAWFRIFNRKNSETNWMRLLEHERDVTFLVFGGFDAENKLMVPYTEFEEDLISGRSEPLDPPPSFETALQTARRQASDDAADAITAAKEEIASVQ